MNKIQIAKISFVVVLAAMLGGCYDSSDVVNKKIADAVANARAPQPITVTLTAPPVPTVPQTAKTTVTPQGGIVVDASNPNHTGIQQNVTVNLPTTAQSCCETQAPRTFNKAPAPRTYYPPAPRPAPQRMSSCSVQVNVVGPPTQVDIKDAKGEVIGSANIVGSGFVAVPCSYARSTTGQTCLSGKNLSWDMDQRWFARARSFLASGQRVLNFGHPITFRKGGAA